MCFKSLYAVSTLLFLLSFCASAPTPPASLCQGDPTSLPSSACSAVASSLRVDLGKLGLVLGATTQGGAAQRFTLPFASKPVGKLRFSSPEPITVPLSISAPYDATSKPHACMQVADSVYGITDEMVSEDCLYMMLYRPAVRANAARPIMVWIHGGSFVSGAARAPGLDASFLAASKDMIVVVLQYRLGMFGFFSPDQFLDEGSANTPATLSGNQGLRDVVLALQFLQANVGAFGGDPHRVTLAGQSSGAHMIRSLLSVPEAAPLFQRAILHSDPANYGTQSRATSNIVSRSALSQSGCTNLVCLRSKSAADILAASTTTTQAGASLDASVASGQVWRPFVGSFTGSVFEEDPKTSIAASGGKPLIITTVANEAGSLVGEMLQPSYRSTNMIHLNGKHTPVTRTQLLTQTFGAARSSVLDSCSQNSQIRPVVQDGLRRNLETILTQSMFTCPAWYNARRYALSGAVYLAIFETGIRYPSNRGNVYCTTSGTVCHEDDILALFADPASLPNLAQRSLARQVQTRWSAFIHAGNPNTEENSSGSSRWDPVTGARDSVNVLRFTSSGAASTTSISLTSGLYAGCSQVWTTQLDFDWQLYT